MTENILTYTLNLQDNLSGKLKKIGIQNEEQLEVWAKVEKQIFSANTAIKKIGLTTATLNDKIKALKDQRDWIPISNTKAIKAATLEINKLENQLRKTTEVSQSFGSKIKGVFSNIGSVIGGFVTSKVTELISGSVDAATTANSYIQRLGVTMSNAMDATQEQVNEIVDMASDSEATGVVSGGATIAGMQELSTYLSQTDSLKTLMPVMQDMLAQQYGFNAAEENAVQIGSMLGKVLNGQVGALSRYGYSFDDAQEKILKFGTEEQKVATLADVVNASVKGVNETLANSKEGDLKHIQFGFDSLKERLGGVIGDLKNALAPAMKKILEIADNIMNYLEDNIDSICDFIENEVVSIIDTIGNVFSFLWKNKDVIVPIIAAITAVVAVVKAWEVAQIALNFVMSANPIGIIVVAIGAMIAAIAVAIKKYNEWGSALLLLLGPLGMVVQLIMTFKRYWDSIVKAFKSGSIIDGIKNIGVALLDFILYPAQQLFSILANIPYIGKFFQGAQNFVNDIRNAIGAIDPKTDTEENTSSDNGTMSNLLSSVGASGNSSNGSSAIADATKKDSKEVSTGGTRNTQITINLDKMVENINFSGGVEDNKENLVRQLEECLNRVLYAAVNTL